MHDVFLYDVYLSYHFLFNFLYSLFPVMCGGPRRLRANVFSSGPAYVLRSLTLSCVSLISKYVISSSKSSIQFVRALPSFKLSPGILNGSVLSILFVANTLISLFVFVQCHFECLSCS